MRDISSAYWLGLQADGVKITEIIELTTVVGAYRFTTNNRTITVSGNAYEPFLGETIDGIKESADMAVNVIDFILANSGGAFDALLETNALDVSSLRIARVFTNSPDLDQMDIFNGYVGDYSHNRVRITGQARNIYGGFEIQWPYYTYMDQCTWRFGSTGCGINTTSQTVSTTVNSGTSDRLEVAIASAATITQDAGYYEKGRITFTSGANSGQIRTIRGHNGLAFTLSHLLPSAPSSGDTADIFPGCRKRFIEDCTSKYNNNSGFLGFPWIPKQENAF